MSETPQGAAERAEMMARLREVRERKEEAVNATNFALAAGLRDEERELERALGPADGKYSVTITRPNGSYCTSEAPTLSEAMEGHGLRVLDPMLADHISNVMHAASMLGRTYYGDPKP